MVLTFDTFKLKLLDLIMMVNCKVIHKRWDCKDDTKLFKNDTKLFKDDTKLFKDDQKPFKYDDYKVDLSLLHWIKSFKMAYLQIEQKKGTSY